MTGAANDDRPDSPWADPASGPGLRAPAPGGPLTPEAEAAYRAHRAERYRLRGLSFRGEVAVNPSPGWMYVAAEGPEGEGGLRGTFLGADLAWWPSGLAMHGQAANWLGLRAPGDALLPAGGPWALRDLEVEFRLWYRDQERRRGRVVGSALVARTPAALERLLSHPSIAPHLDAARRGLRLL